MARKRKVGPGGGDFALNPNRFDYSGGGGGRRGGASIIKKARKETAKPETSMETKKKSTRTRRQLKRLDKKLDEAYYNQQLKDQRKSSTPELEKSPDSRKRVNIQAKGGLREDVKAFKTKLDRQDTSDTNVVKAYKYLKESKHNLNRKNPIVPPAGTWVEKEVWKHADKIKATRDWERRRVKDLAKSLQSAQKEVLETNFKSALNFGRRPKDPTVRKVIRKNKKLIKEKFKEQIKKDRAKRKLDESKKRRQRK